MTWAFGGPLAHLPTSEARHVLLAAAAAISVVAWLSYRFAVVRLVWWKRTLLVLLRTALGCVLLFCLANPGRVTTTVMHPEPPPTPPRQRLAVLVDRSDSMTRADNRGRTRLDDALETWKVFEPSARQAFSSIAYYSFADRLRPANSLDAASRRTGGTDQTALFRNLREVLALPAASRPDLVVALTDGNDTTGDASESLARAAVRDQATLYFIAGVNRSKVEPYFRLHEWHVPSQALPKSSVALEAVFEAFALEDRDQPISLWQQDRRLGEWAVPMAMGHNLVPWRFTFESDREGRVEFTLREGTSADGRVLGRSVTEIAAPRPQSVMVFQCALDWGVRYLIDALRTDPHVQEFRVINSGLRVHPVQTRQVGGMILGGLAASSEAYRGLQCVVLADLYANQLSIGQADALTVFVRNGGSVLFLSPPPAAHATWAGSPIAALLPVTFTGSDQAEPDNESVPLFRLHAFEFTDAGRRSPIFRLGGQPGLVPRFEDYVAGARPKPGTDVLAVYPGTEDVLLATQRFGNGRTAYLGTDSLWRWKMGIPASATEVETFWRQLLLSLAPSITKPQLRFVEAPAEATVGKTVTLRLTGAGSGTATLEIHGPNGASESRPLLPADGTADRQVTWLPSHPGNWELAAREGDGPPAYAEVQASSLPVGEAAVTPPDLDGMRWLAAQTGGALLTRQSKFRWTAPKPPAPPEGYTDTRRTLIWNRWLVLLLALCLFAAELVLRRFWKML